MGNFASYQTTGDSVQEALDIAARERNLNYSPVSPRATADVPHKKLQVDVSPDGKSVVRDQSQKQVAISPTLPDGMVEIPGVGVTTIEAARLAGLLPAGFQEAGKTPAAPAGIQHNQEQPKETPEVPSAADVAISALVTKHGGDVVENAVFASAETGELVVPDGVDEAHVEAVVSQFVSQAERDLKASGASVAMLDETLSDAEARQARMAVINGDKSGLEHFGKLAVQRMETLPYQSPAAFADLIADMPAAERKALTQNDAGEWVVTIPGRGAMPFGSAVRAGIVRIG